jgi:hypothetical protein
MCSLGDYVACSGVHWLSDMIGNIDQNNQVLTVLWRQYLFYDLFNNIEIFLHQNYIYFLVKKYYHV